jgi:S1-C subfamily serine protease
MPTKKEVPDIKKMHEEMLYTSVRIRADQAGGSGTILFSKPESAKKKFSKTFVLTNHHVVEDLICVSEEWDPKLGRKIKKENRSIAQVELFKYNDLSRNVGQTSLDADIVAYDAQLDLALLQVRDTTKAEHVALIIPEGSTEDIHIYDEIIAIGAQLGVPPISTSGNVVYMDADINNARYNMGTYNSIYGSSGGSVFRYSYERAQYEFVGVPARVTVRPMMFDVETITHMSYFIPIESVMGFLDEWSYEFIYDQSKTIAECDDKREEKQSAARKNLERMYGMIEPEGE